MAGGCRGWGKGCEIDATPARKPSNMAALGPSGRDIEPRARTPAYT